MIKKKRIYWDLETSDLKADWGSIFCVGYQVDGEGVKCISIMDFPGWEKEPWNDKRVIEAFVKVLSRDDIAVEVTHYGTNFDIPFLQARMLYHGLGVFPLLGHVDTFYAAKSKLALKSRRLGNVAKHAGIRYKKTLLDGDVWKRAARGDKSSLEYIIKHCVADVRVLKSVYQKLAPLLRKHPAMGDYGSCHNCGSSALVKRGFATTVYAGPRQRFQCKSCGAWTSRKAA